jgi:hypothetical protein
VEIEVFHAALPLGLTCTVITRTVNRLSHVRSASRTHGVRHVCP